MNREYYNVCNINEKYYNQDHSRTVQVGSKSYTYASKHSLFVCIALQQGSQTQGLKRTWWRGTMDQK